MYAQRFWPAGLLIFTRRPTKLAATLPVATRISSIVIAATLATRAPLYQRIVYGSAPLSTAPNSGPCTASPPPLTPFILGETMLPAPIAIPGCYRLFTKTCNFWDLSHLAQGIFRPLVDSLIS